MKKTRKERRTGGEPRGAVSASVTVRSGLTVGRAPVGFRQRLLTSLTPCLLRSRCSSLADAEQMEGMGHPRSGRAESIISSGNHGPLTPGV